jgi:hypothetical protein
LEYSQLFGASTSKFFTTSCPFVQVTFQILSLTHNKEIIAIITAKTQHQIAAIILVLFEKCFLNKTQTDAKNNMNAEIIHKTTQYLVIPGNNVE